MSRHCGARLLFALNMFYLMRPAGQSQSIVGSNRLILPQHPLDKKSGGGTTEVSSALAAADS